MEEEEKEEEEEVVCLRWICKVTPTESSFSFFMGGDLSRRHKGECIESKKNFVLVLIGFDLSVYKKATKLLNRVFSNIFLNKLSMV